MINSIVVPVDFSEDSVNAVKKAFSLAHRSSAKVHLVHVNRVQTLPAIFNVTITSEDDEETERRFTELLNHLPHYGVTVTTSIIAGRVGPTIVRFAEEREADLIVMGTHGVAGFEEFWAGSNAYRVVSRAHCPVLTIRGSFYKDGFRKIVLPIDTTVTTRQKVPFTLELAKIYRAEIHVLGVCIDESNEFVAKLTAYCAQVARYLQTYEVKLVSEMVVGDNPTLMAMNYAKSIDADLISIMTEQETSLSNTFMGAYAQQMVNHSHIPVLSMHKNPLLEGGVSIM